MTVIAMTREMGSCGKDVAIELAERLDLRIVHHNLVEHGVSDRLRIGESDVHRHLEGRGDLLRRWSPSGRAVIDCTVAEVLELAERGDVVVRGWGSTHLLRTVAHVPCVRVCAPLARRVDVLSERLETSRARAREEIVVNDRAHDRLLRRLVRADWRDPLRYDLIVNTARIGIPQGAAMIEQLSRSPAFRPTPASRARLRRLRIEAQIRSRLGEDREASDDVAAINVEVDPETRHVVLSGGIRRRATRETVLGIVGGVPDVARVDDRIALVRD